MRPTILVLLISMMFISIGSHAKPGRELGTLGESCSEELGCVDAYRCADGVCAPPRVSYQTYKLVHILAVLALFMLLGWAGGSGNPSRSTKILHGLATVVVLVGGFGLLARLGISHKGGWPGWAKMKLGLWLLVGLSPILLRKLEKQRAIVATVILGLGATAVYLAVNKPF